MIPSLEGLPTKAKEAPSPHEKRLALLDTNPVFPCLRGTFYFCYLQQCHSIELFSYWTPGHGQKGTMNKVCPSVRKFSWNWLLSFFRNSAWCQGPICYDSWGFFLKKIFLLPKMGKNRPSLRFFQCIRKFCDFFSQFGL